VLATLGERDALALEAQRAYLRATVKRVT